MIERFPPEVVERLEAYVYRLIDPRNGQTFYVGKGRGDRVFQHARGLVVGEEAVGAKLQRIKEIISSGFEVGHVIHRHGLDDSTALEVEGALIDAFPGLTNIRDGGDRAAAHADEIVRRYEVETFVPAHQLVVILIATTFHDETRSIYEAVRYAWRINPRRARKADYVLAQYRGMVKGVFVAEEWLEAKPENFPRYPETREGRWGFVGVEAPEDVCALYMGKRVPDEYRKRGATNPIRFIGPPASIQADAA